MTKSRGWPTIPITANVVGMTPATTMRGAVAARTESSRPPRAEAAGAQGAVLPLERADAPACVSCWESRCSTARRHAGPSFGGSWGRHTVPSALSRAARKAGYGLAVRVGPGGRGGVCADAVEQGGGLGAPALADLGVGEEVEVDQAAGVVLALPLQPPVEGRLHHLAGPASGPVARRRPGRRARCPAAASTR